MTSAYDLVLDYNGKLCRVKNFSLSSLKYLIVDEDDNEYIIDISELKVWGAE